jgi:photosystem II stability/assembly factor-like uncharacterized protein
MKGRTRHRTFKLGLLGLALAAMPVWAGDDTWTMAGQPSGGTVKRVVLNPVSPDTLYAVANPGIFESTDSGVHWSLSLSLPMHAASDVAIDPQNPALLYAGGTVGGVWKSSDGGQTWTGVDNGIPTVEGSPQYPDSIMRVVVDPVNEGVVYAVTAENGIYKTTDAGASWSAANTGLESLLAAPSKYLEALAVDPANPQTLYLGTLVPDPVTGFFGDDALSGIYRSTDGGQHWAEVVTHMAFTDIVIDPSNHQNVYAGGLELYVSVDGGGTWTPATGGSAATVQDVIAVDAADSRHLWGQSDEAGGAFGLYESTDRGAHWSPVYTGDAGAVTSIAIDPVTPTNLYLSSLHYGVYKSGDGGASWAESDDGIYGIVGQVMLMGADSALYLGAQESGVLKSNDGGASWSLAGNGLTVNAYAGVTVYAMAADPADAATLYAGTDYGLFKTTDAAADWSQPGDGLPERFFLAVAVDPEDGQDVYAGTALDGAFKSTDGGSTWQPASAGITDTNVTALAVSPADGSTLFAGTLFQGLFASHDGANTWAPVDMAGVTDGVWAIAIDPADPDTLYVSLSYHDIYKSTDGGRTWFGSSDGLPESAIFGAIQIDPNDTGTLYAIGVFGSGVYVSTDAGAHWQALDNSGLTAAPQAAQPAGSRRHGVMSVADRTEATTGSLVAISAAVVNPRSGSVYGASSDGQVYVYHYVGSSSAGGRPGNGNASGTTRRTGDGPRAGTPGTGQTGGGGGFSWFMGLALIALGSRRRPRAR